MSIEASTQTATSTWEIFIKQVELESNQVVQGVEKETEKLKKINEEVAKILKPLSLSLPSYIWNREYRKEYWESWNNFDREILVLKIIEHHPSIAETLNKILNIHEQFEKTDKKNAQELSKMRELRRKANKKPAWHSSQLEVAQIAGVWNHTSKQFTESRIKTEIAANKYFKEVKELYSNIDYYLKKLPPKETAREKQPCQLFPNLDNYPVRDKDSTDILNPDLTLYPQVKTLIEESFSAPDLTIVVETLKEERKEAPTERTGSTFLDLVPALLREFKKNRKAVQPLLKVQERLMFPLDRKRMEALQIRPGN